MPKHLHGVNLAKKTWKNGNNLKVLIVSGSDEIFLNTKHTKYGNLSHVQVQQLLRDNVPQHSN